ncbi:MAG: hypothetical protein ACMUHX_06415 [bacterium]
MQDRGKQGWVGYRWFSDRPPSNEPASRLSRPRADGPHPWSYGSCLSTLWPHQGCSTGPATSS